MIKVITEEIDAVNSLHVGRVFDKDYGVASTCDDPSEAMLVEFTPHGDLEVIEILVSRILAP